MYNDSNFDIATEAVLKKAFAYTKKNNEFYYLICYKI